MKRFSQYKKYDLTRGEKVNYSYHIALESIFNCFTDRLEELFYDMFNKVFKFRFEIETGIKFQQQIRTIQCPAPIFIFGMSPIEGNSLLILDHSLSNMFLEQSEIFNQNSISVENKFALNEFKSKALGAKVKQFLKTFADCWDHIQPVDIQLKKLVSNSVKSKVMPAHETTLNVLMTAEYQGFSCQSRFIFSAYRLDSLMKEHYQKALIHGESGLKNRTDNINSLLGLLKSEATYEVKGVLGELNTSHLDIVKSLRNGSVLHLQSDIQNNVVVNINEQPVLSAEAGNSNQKMSLKVNGLYNEMKSKSKNKNIPFSKLDFPSS